jgi:hypothetical protein
VKTKAVAGNLMMVMLHGAFKKEIQMFAKNSTSKLIIQDLIKLGMMKCLKFILNRSIIKELEQ